MLVAVNNPTTLNININHNLSLSAPYQKPPKKRKKSPLQGINAFIVKTLGVVLNNEGKKTPALN
jgi:hypothetical protein